MYVALFIAMKPHTTSLFGTETIYRVFPIWGACPFYGTPLFSANLQKFLQSLASDFQPL